MMTTAEAAAILQVSRRRVNELITLGTLQAEKFGRDWQINPASVEAYKNSPRKPGRKFKESQVNVATNVAEKPDSSDLPHHKA